MLWLLRKQSNTRWGERVQWGEKIQPLFGISRGGRVFWWDGKQLHDDLMRIFVKTYYGDLNEKEIQRAGQEILLFTLPPEKLSAKQAIECRNAEVRSLLLQRIGNERLLEELHGRIIDRDRDARLISFDTGQVNAPYRLIRVRDSTTGQFYLLRVPPRISTCHDAIAWTFSLRPDQYNPIKET
ncbi:MAG: hypothetical protein RBG13Loki_2698 [Promethearchaeota archaeon CR_4]|nr:MAG: hypothetical protein RBG13Loki_2698 [Candidatus Lokiarchaeota archaeon CR_4]